MADRLRDFLEKESDDEDEDNPIENARRRRRSISVRLEGDVDDEKDDEEEIGDGVGDVSNARYFGSKPLFGETLVAATKTRKPEYEKEGKKKSFG